MEPTETPSSRERVGLLGARPSHRGSFLLGRFETNHHDVFLLVALVALTATFGMGFSTIGPGGSPIYITEISLAVVSILAAIRLGLGGTIEALRRLPLVPLAVFWLAGVIATVRGLSAEGLTNTIEDVGLFEYSLLLPVVAMVANTMARVDLVRAAIVWGAVGGTFVYLFSDLSVRLFGSEGTFFDVQEITFGLYMAVLVAYVATELAHDRELPRPILIAGAIALLLICLTNARMVWVGTVAALIVAVALAPRGRRPGFAARVAAAVVVSLVLAFGIQKVGGDSLISNEVGGAVRGVSTAQPSSPAAESRSDEKNEAAVLATGSEESENVSWRLAFWKEAVQRTADQPLFGAGFGEPFRFIWADRKYDFRDGNPVTGIDVVGTHNSFIYVLYRMGVPALLALLAAMAFALARLSSLLREPGLPVEARSRVVGLTAMLIAASGLAFFSDAFKGPFLAIFFWIPLALLLIAVELERRQRTDQPTPG